MHASNLDNHRPITLIPSAVGGVLCWMKREWQPEELIECWTLLDRDRRLVANKTELSRVRCWWRTVRRRQNLRPSEGLSICATVTLSIGTLRIAERTASTRTLPGGRPSPGQPCCRPPPSSKVRRASSSKNFSNIANPSRVAPHRARA